MTTTFENPLMGILEKFQADYLEAIADMNKVMVDYGKGKALLRKTNDLMEALAQVVSIQGDLLECLIQKEMNGIEAKKIKNLEDTLMKHEQKLKIAENKIQKLESDATEIERLNRTHEVKTSKTNQTGDAKTSKNAKNSCQEGNSIPESLLLDHLQTVDFEKSNVTIYGIPNEQFLSDYEETGNQIVEGVMNGEKVRVKSIKNVRNTKMDKDDTFRLLIKFASPYEAQKFVGKCDKNATWSYRLGMTKLERHYSKQTVTRISNLNRNLLKDCGYKYVRSGIFSFTKTPL